MAFRVTSDTRIRDDAKDAAAPLRSISVGTVLKSENEKKDGWVKVSFKPPASPLAIVGWVPEKDCVEVPDGPRPQVDQLGFVLECYLAERQFNKDQTISHWVISAELLIGRAQFETGVTNAGPQPATPDGVGPLQVTVAEWTDFATKGGPLVSSPAPERRDHPIFQIGAAAWRMHKDIKAISDAKTPPTAAGQEPPPLFMPTYLDVFHAYLLGDPAAAVSLIDAQATDAGKQKTIKEVLGWEQAKVDDLFKRRIAVLGVTPALKVSEFVAATDKALADALKWVFDFTKKNAPDELPTVPAPPEVTVTPVDTGGLIPFPAEPPFATTDTRLDQMFWPVITGLREAMVVSYKDAAGNIVGNRSRCFFADRNGGNRHHVGMDIYCKEGDVVVACADGTVVNFYPFYRTKTGEQSFALFVAHEGVVINYGEVKGGGPVKKGDPVKAGDKIGIVSSTDMIHFETYVPSTTQNSRWLRGEQRPARLLNPTKLLLDLAANATRILPNGNKVLGTGNAQIAQAPNQPLSMNENDLLTLARTIYGEARGEKPAGREAVAHVVITRLQKKFRGATTIAEVCKSRRQFSCWNADDPNLKVIATILPDADPIFKQCCEVAEQVIKGLLPDNTGGATHYYSQSIAPPDWSGPPAQQTAHIGSHLFFKNVP